MILALNGSPRKKWNTATLLGKVLEGAREAGAETEMVHLHDLDFRGCVSCFACKRKGGRHGHCAMRDGLSPLLEKIRTADALVLGSPIYYWNVTADMRAFLERFLFSNMLYIRGDRWRFPKKMPSALIYTWGADPQRVNSKLSRFAEVEESLAAMLGSAPLTLHSVDAWQFDDYDKYEASAIDLDSKQRQRSEVFPEDCAKAMEFGRRLAVG